MTCSFVLLGSTSGNGQEEFELWGKLVFGVESVGEIDTTDSAVSVNLDSIHRKNHD
jgi:hypothetical protein